MLFFTKLENQHPFYQRLVLLKQRSILYKWFLCPFHSYYKNGFLTGWVIDKDPQTVKHIFDLTHAIRSLYRILGCSTVAIAKGMGKDLRTAIFGDVWVMDSDFVMATFWFDEHTNKYQCK